MCWCVVAPDSMLIFREYNVARYPELMYAKNYCRNPGGKKTKPWCYSQPLGQEEYCDVSCPLCFIWLGYACLRFFGKAENDFQKKRFFFDPELQLCQGAQESITVE